MVKKDKLKTPDWVTEGYDSREAYEKAKGIHKEKKKGKIFKVKKCPECGNSEVGVVLSGEEGKGTGEWECKGCGWKGKSVDETEFSETEFLEHLAKMRGK